MLLGRLNPGLFFVCFLMVASLGRESYARVSKLSDGQLAAVRAGSASKTCVETHLCGADTDAATFQAFISTNPPPQKPEDPPAGTCKYSGETLEVYGAATKHLECVGPDLQPPWFCRNDGDQTCQVVQDKIATSITNDGGLTWRCTAVDHGPQRDVGTRHMCVTTQP